MAPRFIKTPSFIEQTGTANPLNGFDVGDNSAPVLGDIDDDGDLDAFIGQKDGTFKYYQNTGTKYLPKFVEVTGANNPLNGFKAGTSDFLYSTLALADLDADGDLDAFSGAGDGTFNYYQNTGTKNSPKFVEVTGGNNPLNGFDVDVLSRPVLADMDADGDFDAFSGANDGTFKYYQNTGTKTSPKFVEVTGGNNPLNGFDVGENSAPMLVDLDADGDFDAFSGTGDGIFKYYQNTGTKTSPKFVEVTGTSNPLNNFDAGILSTPMLVDLDADGDFDAFSGEGYGTIKFYKDTSPEYTYNLAGIKKNETAPWGNTIGEIITDGTAQVEAVAITAVDNSKGKWQYSTDGGNTWQDFGTVTETNARLLDSTNRVRFIPDGNSTGTANMTLRLWDKSTGVVGETADVSNNGGNTAFSAASTIATVNVVNQVIQTLVVTQATDNGKGDVTGSLSWAIKQANQTVGGDIVELQTDVRLDIKDDDPNTLDPARSLVIINSDLTIKGNNKTISGDDNNNGIADKDGSDSPILFIKQGVVSIENVTLENGVAKGGNSYKGGGGAGMGGALFIYQGNVNLTNVAFKNNHAVGGSTGKWTGNYSGGGMGGNATSTGGGGLFGSTGATDPAAYITPGSKGSDGVNNPGSGSNPLGSFGGRGGNGGPGAFSGWGENAGSGGAGGFAGGGGIGGNTSDPSYGGNGGVGGFGGGGGAGGLGKFGGHGGAGGFGGGGGYAVGFKGNGGNGGFGGGGPGSWATNVNHPGGFGGGNAKGQTGGGGAGMGGAIFIHTGSVNLNNVTLENNSATGGTGANNGQGLGDAIFIINSAAKTAQTTQGNNQGMPSELAIVNGNGVYILDNSHDSDANGSGAGAYGVENINDTTANISPNFTAPASLPEQEEDPSSSQIQTETINNLFHQKIADNNLKATLKGIAIVGNTANPTTEGKWQYSTDGNNWYDIGTVGYNNTALALSYNTSLRFLAVANYDRTIALQVRAIDETYTGSFTNGATRQTIDTSVNGNGQPISENTATISITIQAINDDPPTDITLEGNTIEENKPKGTLVGVLDSNDPDTGDTQTYRLVYKNPFFQINGDNLETKLPLIYDESGDNSFELLIEVKDQTGATYQEALTVNVLPTFQNHAPTDIILSNNSIEENQPVATAVGNLTTVDPDAGQTYTYQILTPNVPFVIENGVLKTTALLDYETQTSYDLEIETNDGNGGTYKETLTVQVNDIPDSATINLTPTDLKVIEGLNNAVFDITVKGASGPVTVSYHTENGTAIAGNDYTAKTETLTFDTNGTKQITIPIVNNNESEADETFKVVVGNQQATVTVTDTQEVTTTSNLPTAVENLTLLGEGHINGTGNTGNNVITGNSGNNTLSGGGGNDTLTGNEGNDILNGGTAADSLTGGSGNDNYYVDNAGDKVTEKAGEGTDRVFSSLEYTLEEEGNVENLTLNGSKPINGTGNTQNNIIIGNNLNNTLTGLGGSDALDGKGGADTLEGGSGNDTYHVDNPGDTVKEDPAQGTDRVFSYLPEYIFPDNVEILYLQGEIDGKGTGNVSNNTIVGDNSDNELTGGAGNDLLTGGTGNDILTGGVGSDRFYFYSPEEGVDTITDFSNTGKIKDKLYLNATGFGLEKGTLTSDQFTLESAASNSSHRFIYNNGALFYDADGNGAENQVHLATFKDAPVLGVSDIVLF